MAGRLLLLTALATVVMVLGRVAADADESTLAESLAAISSNQGPYRLSGASRLMSGITLFAGAWYLSRASVSRQLLGTRLVTTLLALSGAFTAASGALAIALATLAPDVAPFGSLSPLFRLAETTSDLRGVTGRVGFALAGLVLVVATRHLWRAGGVLRQAAPLSAVIGIAMQFIWIESATFAHRMVGAAFFVWLVTAGVMLAAGYPEKSSIGMAGDRAGHLREEA